MWTGYFRKSKTGGTQWTNESCIYIAHLRQQCHNSKRVVFQERLLKILKCYNFPWVQRRHNCSPAVSFANCVMALYLLKVHLQTFLSIPITQKYQILSCDTLVANERYTECPRRNGQNFGRVFLMLNYTDITQNTYIQSWTGTEIMAREVWNFDSCYTLTDYQIHKKNWQEYVVSVMLISVLNIKVNCEWYKAIK